MKDATNAKPFIVAVEGPDGVGKTTLVNALWARLKHEERAVYRASLPSTSVVPWAVLLSGASSGLPLGDPRRSQPPSPTECLRHALDQGPLAPILLLLDGARAVEDGRKAPAGTIVIHDRSSLSTAVYQGHKDACLDLTGTARPDLVLLLTASAEVLEHRRRARGPNRDGEHVGLMDYRSAAAAAVARGWIIREIRTDVATVNACVDEAIKLIEMNRS